MVENQVTVWADLPIFLTIMVLALLTSVYQMIRYFLSSKTSFTVQKQTFLSDHCQIALWLETNEVISRTYAKSTYVWTKLLPGFKWNKNSETKFKQVLNTPKFCSIIEKFNNTEFTHDYYKGVENASDKLSSIH